MLSRRLVRAAASPTGVRSASATLLASEAAVQLQSPYAPTSRPVVVTPARSYSHSANGGGFGGGGNRQQQFPQQRSQQQAYGHQQQQQQQQQSYGRHHPQQQQQRNQQQPHHQHQQQQGYGQQQQHFQQRPPQQQQQQQQQFHAARGGDQQKSGYQQQQQPQGYGQQQQQQARHLERPPQKQSPHQHSRPPQHGHHHQQQQQQQQQQYNPAAMQRTANMYASPPPQDAPAPPPSQAALDAAIHDAIDVIFAQGTKGTSVGMAGLPLPFVAAAVPDHIKEAMDEGVKQFLERYPDRYSLAVHNGVLFVYDAQTRLQVQGSPGAAESNKAKKRRLLAEERERGRKEAAAIIAARANPSAPAPSFAHLAGVGGIPLPPPPGGGAVGGPSGHVGGVGIPAPPPRGGPPSSFPSAASSSGAGLGAGSGGAMARTESAMRATSFLCTDAFLGRVRSAIATTPSPKRRDVIFAEREPPQRPLKMTDLGDIRRKLLQISCGNKLLLGLKGPGLADVSDDRFFSPQTQSAVLRERLLEGLGRGNNNGSSSSPAETNRSGDCGSGSVGSERTPHHNLVAANAIIILGNAALITREEAEEHTRRDSATRVLSGVGKSSEAAPITPMLHFVAVRVASPDGALSSSPPQGAGEEISTTATAAFGQHQQQHRQPTAPSSPPHQHILERLLEERHRLYLSLLGSPSPNQQQHQHSIISGTRTLYEILSPAARLVVRVGPPEHEVLIGGQQSDFMIDGDDGAIAYAFVPYGPADTPRFEEFEAARRAVADLLLLASSGTTGGNDASSSSSSSSSLISPTSTTFPPSFTFLATVSPSYRYLVTDVAEVIAADVTASNGRLVAAEAARRAAAAKEMRRAAVASGRWEDVIASRGISEGNDGYEEGGGGADGGNGEGSLTVADIRATLRTVEDYDINRLARFVTADEARHTRLSALIPKAASITACDPLHVLLSAPHIFEFAEQPRTVLSPDADGYALKEHDMELSTMFKKSRRTSDKILARMVGGDKDDVRDLNPHRLAATAVETSASKSFTGSGGEDQHDFDDPYAEFNEEEGGNGNSSSSGGGTASQSSAHSSAAGLHSLFTPTTAVRFCEPNYIIPNATAVRFKLHLKYHLKPFSDMTDRQLAEKEHEYEQMLQHMPPRDPARQVFKRYARVIRTVRYRIGRPLEPYYDPEVLAYLLYDCLSTDMVPSTEVARVLPAEVSNRTTAYYMPFLSAYPHLFKLYDSGRRHGPQLVLRADVCGPPLPGENLTAEQLLQTVQGYVYKEPPSSTAATSPSPSTDAAAADGGVGGGGGGGNTSNANEEAAFGASDSHFNKGHTISSAPTTCNASSQFLRGFSNLSIMIPPFIHRRITEFGYANLLEYITINSERRHFVLRKRYAPNGIDYEYHVGLPPGTQVFRVARPPRPQHGSGSGPSRGRGGGGRGRGGGGRGHGHDDEEDGDFGDEYDHAGEDGGGHQQQQQQHQHASPHGHQQQQQQQYGRGRGGYQQQYGHHQRGQHHTGNFQQ